jgi:hypothetical protein
MKHCLLIVGLFFFASISHIYAQTEYIPATVEDTPQFKMLKVKVENDGYTYSHFETGTGIAVYGKRGNSTKWYGDKNEGMMRIPGGDRSKAYYVTWDQYFSAFSEMHKACFEDINVREIKAVVDQIVLETDYDYAQLYRAPNGAQWVFHPETKYKGVCDDYSNLVIQRVARLAGVKKVIKVSSRIGNHAWNEIHLNDGRIIYCDSTWYDTNGYSLDQRTGNYIVDHEPHYMPTMFTFDKRLFSLGRTHYDWGDARE